MVENKKDNSTSIILLIITVMGLLWVFVGRHNQPSKYDKVMREQVYKKYKSSGTIDCTGYNSQSAECKYLLSLPVDSGGSYEPW